MKWTSFEEKMPDKGQRILVCRGEVVWCIYATRGLTLEAAKHAGVTHWMPLPKAPEVKQ